MRFEKRSSPEFLERRDRSVFVSERKSWTDHRAWIASCLFHTTFLVVFAFLWKPQSRGTNGEPDRPVGIAVLHQTTSGNEFFLEGGASSASNRASKSTSSVIAVNETAGPPISVDSLIADLLGTENSNATNSNVGEAMGTGLLGNGLSGGTGTSRGAGAGSKTKTSFFGVEGTGASFVFVVDRSDSMNTYDLGPLRAAKREVLKCLETLKDYHQFQIVFYNDSVIAANGNASRMVFATDSDKERATNFVRMMPGAGGTEHLPAIKLGLSMAPDVLFFLTDADDPSLSSSQLADIQQRAVRTKTTIHSIQFNVGEDVGTGSWIRALAEMNRGTYKYVDIAALNEPPKN